MYDINQKWTEMRRSYFTREITYTDDCDFITEDPKVKKKHSRIVSNTENWKSTEKWPLNIKNIEEIFKRNRNVAANKMSRIWLNNSKIYNGEEHAFIPL